MRPRAAEVDEGGASTCPQSAVVKFTNAVAQLEVVRRLAFDAADWCLLGPELAVGVRQVKGVPRGGWTPVEEPIICDLVFG